MMKMATVVMPGQQSSHFTWQHGLKQGAGSTWGVKCADVFSVNGL
jgi:hypothetical protein